MSISIISGSSEFRSSFVHLGNFIKQRAGKIQGERMGKELKKIFEIKMCYILVRVRIPMEGPKKGEK